MKKILFIIAALAILFSSCGTRTNENTDSHTHDDGTVHADHQNGSDTIPEQEIFEVQNDSDQLGKDTLKSADESDHEHSHENGHEHQH